MNRGASLIGLHLLDGMAPQKGKMEETIKTYSKATPKFDKRQPKAPAEFLSLCGTANTNYFAFSSNIYLI